MLMWRSMAVSFTVEAVVIVAIILISITTVDSLGAIALPQPMPPLPRAPKAVQIVATARAATSTPSNLRVAARPFVVPNRIPVGVPRIEDGPEMMLAEAPAVGGAGFGSVANGVPGGTSFTRLLTEAPPPPPPAPVSKPKEHAPVRLGGVVMEAKLIKRVMPVYPPLARQMRISGTVSLEGVISRDGKVINLQVVSGHPLLTQAAVDAVRQWIYRPTLLNGQSVEVIAPIQVHFTLAQ
jgi:protein TonB